MVARKFGVGIDLGGKQVKGMVLENLASDNLAIAKEGSAYFNTTNKKLKVYQNGKWEDYATKGESDAVAEDLANEITRATTEEERLAGLISAEETRATTAEGVLQDNIDAEETRATTEEERLAGLISAEETRATTAEGVLQDNIDAEETRATEAESAIATDLLNLGKALWKNYTSNKATSGYFYTSLTNQDTSVATVFNESDGGGLKFENKPANMVSAIAVNNGNATDIAAQIYSKYISNKDSEVQNYGTRLNINPNAIYYTKGTVTTATAGDARNEIAVLKDIDTLETSIDNKLDLKADKADTYTKSEIDARMSTVYDYKGTVDVMGDLPKTDQKIGDVWNVVYKVVPGGDPTDPDDLIPWGMNVAWNGTAWDELGQIIDLSPYAKIADVAATYETIANCNLIRGRLDTLESDVAQLQSDVNALKALTALQPKKATYANPELSMLEGTATWTIDYTGDIDNDDIQVTIKEVVSGEEIEADVKQSVGGDVLTGKVTISFETDANIPANTYKAIIIG